MRKKCLAVLFFIAIAVVALSLPVNTVAADFVMIGNRSVPVSELSQSDIQNIYLGKKKVWDNGMKIELAVLGDGPVTEAFLKDCVKRNSNTFDMHWKKQVFTGGGKPPVKFEKEKELVQYVSSNKGALGYVPSGAVSENVKVILVKGE